MCTWWYWQQRQCCGRFHNALRPSGLVSPPAQPKPAHRWELHNLAFGKMLQKDWWNNFAWQAQVVLRTCDNSVWFDSCFPITIWILQNVCPDVGLVLVEWMISVMMKPLQTTDESPAPQIWEAQRALEFIHSLEVGSSMSTGFSTNVDMVANALGRGAAYTPWFPTDSDAGVGETMERYFSSIESEVSDPDLWIYLHHGDGMQSTDENESNSAHGCWCNPSGNMSVCSDDFSCSHESWVKALHCEALAGG